MRTLTNLIVKCQGYSRSVSRARHSSISLNKFGLEPFTPTECKDLYNNLLSATVFFKFSRARTLDSVSAFSCGESVMDAMTLGMGWQSSGGCLEETENNLRRD